MNLTPEQFAILAHVVVDPQAWADHAEATFGAEIILAKIDKYQTEYLSAKDQPGYKTRAGREVPPPLTAEQLAAIAQAQTDTAAIVAVKADTVIQYLRDHTPAECEAYVQAQVTDLASARQLMKKFAVALCVLAKGNLR